MTDYTPTTEQVRRYWQYGANAWRDEVARDDDAQADGTSIGAEFDRWLADHDVEVAEKARADERERIARGIEAMVPSHDGPSDLISRRSAAQKARTPDPNGDNT